MKLSDLKDFFDNEISASEFNILIDPEVQEYRRRLSVKGRSAPVTVNEDIDLSISKDAVAQVCSAYLHGDLTESAVQYIADAVLLSHFAERVSFAEEGLQDVIALLTDPEVNGPVTKDSVLGILIQLSLPN